MQRPGLLALLIFLAACEKAAPPSLPPPSPAVAVTGQKSDVGHWVKSYRFTLDATGCSSIALRLLHITEDGVQVKTEYVYKGLSARTKGTFGIVEQHGEAFDKPGEITYDLQQEIPAENQTAMSTNFPMIQGPFPDVAEQFHKNGPVPSGTETLVFARCMSLNASHSFGAGSVESLKQHAAETKDVIVALTLRWDP